MFTYQMLLIILFLPQCLFYPLIDYCAQIMRAVFHLHKYNIIHRDIKPENILIGPDNVLKLADFGWAVSDKNGFKDTHHKRTTLCGTLDYLPPEMVENRPYSESVDTWTIGVLLYEMLTGSPPFMAPGTENTYKKIQECVVDFPDYVSPEAKGLIQMLLQRDSTKRPNINVAIQHPFFAKHGISGLA
jgi:aurora kinase